MITSVSIFTEYTAGLDVLRFIIAGNRMFETGQDGLAAIDPVVQVEIANAEGFFFRQKTINKIIGRHAARQQSQRVRMSGIVDLLTGNLRQQLKNRRDTVIGSVISNHERLVTAQNSRIVSPPWIATSE
jgi:hypothetical protein